MTVTTAGPRATAATRVSSWAELWAGLMAGRCTSSALAPPAPGSGMATTKRISRADTAPGTRLDRVALALLGLAFLAVIAGRMPFLSERLLNVDEAIYATVADRWLVGEVPYRDTWDNKPPAIYALYAVSFRLLGRSLVPLRVATILAALVVVCCLYGLGNRLRSARAGALAGLAYSFASVNGAPVDTLAANTEVFLVAGTSLAAYLVVRGPERRSYLVGAGAAAAAACLFKPVAAFDLAAVGLVLVALRSHRHQLPWLGLGLPVVLVPVAGYLAWRGALGAAAQQVIGFNLGPYASGLSWAEALERGREMSSYLLSLNLPIAAFALAGVAWLVVDRQAPRLPRAVALAWLSAALLGTAWGKRFMGHYFLQALPPACLLAGYGLSRAANPLRQTAWRQPRSFAVAALFLLVGVAWYRSGDWPGRTWVESVRRLRREGSLNAHDSDRAWRIGQYLRDHTTPKERIFAWGFYPQAYLFSGRLPATAFPMCVFLTGFSPGDEPDKVALQSDRRAYPEAWDRLRRDFERQPPTYIVDTAPLGRGYIIPYDRFPISRYPWLAALVDRDYQLETTIGKVRLYRLRETQAHGGHGNRGAAVHRPGAA